MNKINIGIVGYGNLGRGVETCVKNFSDINLVGIFSRRPPSDIKTTTPVYSYNNMGDFAGKIDVMIMCGGSANDLMVQTPDALKLFNVIDSFDTHSLIPQHYANVDETGKKYDKLGAISIGWDPGLFSLTRTLFDSILPNGQQYTFWGKGVSQGHSDAIRRIDGVQKAVQYTIPKPNAVNAAKSSTPPEFTVKQKHFRECFIVCNDKSKHEIITRTVVNMPNYFADYDTVVHFISEEEFNLNHTAMPHAGTVIKNSKTSQIAQQILQLQIQLDSNPEFTASCLLAYARAVKRLYDTGRRGAVTILDIPVSLISPLNSSQLRTTV